MQIRNNMIERMNSFGGTIVHIIANVSGRTEAKARIVIIVILVYIIGIIVMITIHRKLLKKHKKVHENLVLLYDTLRYQVARVQYGNTEIQDKRGITTVIEADHKNYLANSKEIKQEILSIEQKLGQEIIGTNQRITIEQQAKKKNKLMAYVQPIGRVITVLTLGIYKLFW